MDIEEALNRLKEARTDRPPKVIRESEHHVVVRGNGERLDRDFKSSGTE